jgi:hypothetical protein
MVTAIEQSTPDLDGIKASPRSRRGARRKIEEGGYYIGFDASK